MLSSQMSGDTESFPRFFPPPAEQKEVWHNIGTIMSDALKTSAISADDIAHFKRFTDLYKAVNSGNAANYVAVKRRTTRWNASRKQETNPATWLWSWAITGSTIFTRRCCVSFSPQSCLGLSWASPGSGFSKGCVRLCVALCIVGAALSTYGIIVRCLIMERPPITNLYETIIFISAAGVIGALVAEWMTKKGWALTVATVAGTGGMFLSIRFMTMEGRDTMEQLQAVLITNFWLATHVPCVNLGYAVCMVAAIFSAIYVVLKLAGKIKGGDSSARELTRLAYSFVMAGLLLSLVGTVLGGIWANYSWGRFWGWDPKENGALLIVLMCLVILHARLGGYIKEAGFHNANLFLGMIVLFSWFATNQLGIGLHSYGAMEGAWMWLYIFWGTFTALIVVGVVLSFLDRTQRSGVRKIVPRARSSILATLRKARLSSNLCHCLWLALAGGHVLQQGGESAAHVFAFHDLIH
jgi:ABC-type transport system involved in cytochrome c biogenesis permease subunit